MHVCDKHAAVSCKWENSMCADIFPSLSPNTALSIKKKFQNTYSFTLTFKLDIYIPLPIGAQEIFAHPV